MDLRHAEHRGVGRLDVARDDRSAAPSRYARRPAPDRCPASGRAPCAPLPVTVMSKKAPPAIIAPVRMANLPTGRPGRLCMPKTASHGKRSNSPSSIIASAPPRPSSAGWKMKLDRAVEIARLGEIARRAQQHRGVAVMAAGMHPARACCERCAKSFASRIGSASMSARSPIERGELPTRSTPTTPVLPTPRCTSMPNAGEPLGDELGGALLLEAELGMRVDVAPPRGQLVVKFAHFRDQLHTSPPRGAIASFAHRFRFRNQTNGLEAGARGQAIKDAPAKLASFGNFNNWRRRRCLRRPVAAPPSVPHAPSSPPPAEVRLISGRRGQSLERKAHRASDGIVLPGMTARSRCYRSGATKKAPHPERARQRAAHRRLITGGRIQLSGARPTSRPARIGQHLKAHEAPLTVRVGGLAGPARLRLAGPSPPTGHDFRLDKRGRRCGMFNRRIVSSGSPLEPEIDSPAPGGSAPMSRSREPRRSRRVAAQPALATSMARRGAASTSSRRPSPMPARRSTTSRVRASC